MGDYLRDSELRDGAEAFSFFQSFLGFVIREKRMMFRREKRVVRLTCKDACISGSNAAVLSGVVLSLCSKIEEGSAAGALNGPSQWIWGEREAYTRRATARHTLVGYTIHHASSMLWALAYEHAFGRCRSRASARVPVPQILAEAAATAAVAYCVDYYVTPRRLRPGFRKHLGPGGMFASYAAFGLGLALTTLAKRRTARVSASAAPSSRAR